MRKTIVLVLGAALLCVSGVAGARIGDRLRERIAQRMAADDGPSVPAPQHISYGPDPLQSIDLWQAKLPSDPAMPPSPLIVFVHGGGWKRGDKDNATGRWKEAHFPGEGYAFASIDYRLVPQATVEEQASDVAHALAALIERAPALGIDPHRIALMGHSAGAHLVALVGTDEQYLKGAGLSFASLAGVIPIDGAAYDVPAQMNDGPAIMQATYKQAFGTDPARQRALSPSLQAGAPNAARFLVLHVQRPDGLHQSAELESALKAAGTAVQDGSFPGTGLSGHMEINRRLGDPAYAATGVVDTWLRQVVGK